MRAGAVSGYSASSTTNTYYSMADWQGSILGMTDATGSVAAQYRYNPYGRELDASGTGSGNNDLRWLAAQRDADTHLYHLGARYYSPSLGVFLQVDPKQHTFDVLQQDRYGYGGGDPANETDRNGQQSGDTCAEGGSCSIDSTEANAGYRCGYTQECGGGLDCFLAVGGTLTAIGGYVLFPITWGSSAVFATSLAFALPSAYRAC